MFWRRLPFRIIGEVLRVICALGALIASQAIAHAQAPEEQLKQRNDQALVLYRSGSLERAIIAVQQAIDFSKRHLPANNYQATRAFELAAVLHARKGDLQASEKYFEEAVRSVNRAVVPFWASRLLSDLATISMWQGKYENAVAFERNAFEASVAAKSRGLGDHEERATADLSENLADLYTDQGRYIEAIPLYERALQIRQKIPAYGYDITILLEKLATALAFHGQWEASEKLYGDAVQMRRSGNFFTTAQGLDIALKDVAVESCLAAGRCTGIRVFFGTDRQLKPLGGGREPVFSVGEKRGDTLTVGTAVITVPRARSRGSVAVPNTGSWNLLLDAHGDPNQHFRVVAANTIKNAGDFASAVQEPITSLKASDHVVVFVHGYRTSFKHALFRAAQVAYDLTADSGQFGTVFAYSWPSADDAKAYAYDMDSARGAIPYFAEFIRIVRASTPSKKLHLIVHSMGNVPVLNALKEMANKPDTILFDELILAAPDLDRREFASVLPSLRQIAKGVTLYVSSDDNALVLSRKIRLEEPRAGDAIDPPGPIVLAGVDTIDISNVDSAVLSWNHSRVIESRILLNDISRVLRYSERPPHDRNINFSPIKKTEGIYWRYAP